MQKFPRERITALLWLVPAFIPIFLFLIYPIIYNFLEVFRSGGFENFTLIFNDPVFHIALKNSFIFASIGAGIAVFLALLIAIIITSRESSVGTATAILMLVSWITPEIVTAVTFNWMLNSTYGIINWIGRWIGLFPRGIPWLGDPTLAPIVVPILIVWRLIPFLVLLFVSGILSIPIEYIESAKVDGMKFKYKLRYIILPSLKYPLTIAYILIFVWIFNDFTMVAATTGGGPLHLTEILSTYIYKEGFTYFKFNIASAASVFQFIVLLALSLTYLYVFRRMWRFR